MTGVLIIRVYLDTEGRLCEDTAIYKPRRVALEKTNPANTWIADFYLPEW